VSFFSSNNDAALVTQMYRIERKLDAIMLHLGIALPSDGMDDIRALIAAGKKIEAIKQYRERTGADLAQAKLAIDSGL
jgi:hypothetical protein